MCSTSSNKFSFLLIRSGLIFSQGLQDFYCNNFSTLSSSYKTRSFLYWRNNNNLFGPWYKNHHKDWYCCYFFPFFYILPVVVGTGSFRRISNTESVSLITTKTCSSFSTLEYLDQSRARLFVSKKMPERKRVAIVGSGNW